MKGSVVFTAEPQSTLREIFFSFPLTPQDRLRYPRNGGGRKAKIQLLCVLGVSSPASSGTGGDINTSNNALTRITLLGPPRFAGGFKVLIKKAMGIIGPRPFSNYIKNRGTF